MKKSNKVFSAISYILLFVLIVLVIYLVAMKSTNKVPNFFGNSFVRIVSASMEKEIPTGSYILIKSAEAEDIEVGDVITFYSSDPSILNQANTHRVVEIKNDNGQISFVTKGDNNQLKDQYQVSGDKLIGKYVKVLPTMTYLGNILNNKLVFLVLVLIPAIVLVFLEVKNVVKKTKEVKQQQLIEQEVEKLRQADKEKNNSEKGD